MAAEILDVTSMVPNKFEPKRKNRFIMMTEGVDAFIVKTSARPSFTSESIEVSWINATRYLSGKQKVGPISMTLHDPIAPSGAQQIMEWLRLHYEQVSGRAGYADFYKRDLQIKILDPIGTVIELWDLKGCLITETNFGELTYESADLAEISLTIQPDFAILQF